MYSKQMFNKMFNKMHKNIPKLKDINDIYTKYVSKSRLE